MRILFLSLAWVCCAAAAQAQTATDSVKATIDNLFAAIHMGDSAALNKCFAPGSVLQTVAANPQGEIVVHNEPIPEFAASVAKLNRDDADERIVYDVIKVDAELAMVWTPYQLYYKGNFSHCGVNAFLLARLNGEWKIQHIIDTRRKDNCVATPQQ